ncbi:MAG: hypothetical protein QM682_14765 [Paracoccus sp. (in: a-proteobacteria)]|uniref:hypothetical protein n=1 Tax=Paracoccus sp. TaxID=267 RepID=UPI0039E358B8
MRPVSALIAALFASLALSAPVRAQAPLAPPPMVRKGLEVMMCELQDQSGTGWIPEFLMVTRQTAGAHAGRIEVFDPILQTLVRRPVAAVITAEDRRSRSYGWALGNVSNESGQYTDRLDYRLTLRKSDGAAWISVTAAGYENRMQGQGRCASPPPG